MTTSYTRSKSSTFSRTSARRVASKVATDLRLMQIYYGKPSDFSIERYEIEVVELLLGGYLGTVKYGFQRNDLWVPPVLTYAARLDGTLTADDRPGRVPRGENIIGASFSSYLTYSAAWSALSPEEQDRIKKSLPFYRHGALEPTVGAGLWSLDKIYSRDGGGLSRSSLRSS